MANVVSTVLVERTTCQKSISEKAADTPFFLDEQKQVWNIFCQQILKEYNATLQSEG